MKKTNKEIISFRVSAIAFLKKDENKDSKTKLNYALEKLIKSTDVALDKYFEDRKDIGMDNCNVDSNKSLLYEDLPSGQRKFEFTKEGLKAYDKQTAELLDKKVDIKTYISTELPEDFPLKDYQDLWEGFVLEPSLKTKK